MRYIFWYAPTGAGRSAYSEVKRVTLRANFALSILAVAVAATGAFGQDRELTVEELFLQDIEFEVLKE